MSPLAPLLEISTVMNIPSKKKCKNSVGYFTFFENEDANGLNIVTKTKYGTLQVEKLLEKKNIDDFYVSWYTPG